MDSIDSSLIEKFNIILDDEKKEHVMDSRPIIIKHTDKACLQNYRGNSLFKDVVGVTLPGF